MELTKNQKIYAAIGVVVVVLIVLASSLSYRKNNGELAFGAAGAGYASIHNPLVVATSTLTTAYTGAGAVSSSRLAVDGFPNLVFAGNYTPNTYGSRVYIQVQRSIDGGLTYYPYMTITPETGDVLINSSGTSTTNGSPFVVPGNAIGTSASGTTIGFSFDLTLVADFIKIAAKEVTTSTAGTLKLQFMGGAN